ncbi:FecR family protein [Limisalsivibrio acetivorans]|uniref:FecR family protein n=1 Tax=Limisalsivibrio acetivorans TaxID=1304888 RepID=UPI0003B3E269|nr:FecR family protein [Limisalsivibrio acetivorans]
MRLLIYTLLATMLAIPAFSADRAGEVSDLQGRVEILHDQEVMGKRARTGAELVVKDLLRTKRKGYAEVSLIDGSVVKVYEKTRMKINGIERGDDYNADIQKGRVLFDIAKVENVTGDFRVKTTTSIIGVKGTAFRIDVLPELTKVTVTEGVVEVSRIDAPDVSVLVNQGESVLIREGDENLNVQEEQVEDEEEVGGFEEQPGDDVEEITDSEDITQTIEDIEDNTGDVDDIYEKPEDREDLVEVLTGTVKINIDFEK